MANEHYTRLDDEQELLQRTAAGSREAFSVLYSHYYPGLYRYVFFILKSQEDTEEIIQDVFLKIWVKRETLPGIRAFDDYLFRMAKNRLFDIAKQSKARMKVSRDIASRVVEKGEPGFDDLVFRQYHEVARQAINLLPARRKEVFLMNARDELSAREIAERLGISLPAVKKDLREASYFIRDHLRRNAGWLIFLAFWIGSGGKNFG